MQITLSFVRMMYLYGVGSFMAAAAIAANWFIREMMGGGIAVVSVQPDMASYYMPMVFGGICAWLFILPINMLNWVHKGLIFGLVPALTYLSLRSGGFDKILEFLTPDRFLRHDTLLVVLVFCLVWGLGVSYFANKHGQGHG